MDDLPPEDVLAAVDAAVAELLDIAGVAAPPVDAVALARDHLGLPPPPERRGPRPPRDEDRHWAAARAVAARLRPALLRRLGLDPASVPPAAAAQLATLFARRLLVPAAWFAADTRACGHDLVELKALYRTAGYEAIAGCWLELPAPCIVAVVDHEQVVRRRGNAGRVPRGLSPAEEACRRQVIDTGVPRRVRAGGWDVRGWPVPGSPRIILRGEVEGLGD